MVPGLCCGFLRLMQEIEKDGTTMCDIKTQAKTGRFFRDIIALNVADALDLMCGNFGSIENCQEKAPKILEQLNLKMKENEPIYNHTAFTSLLKFIERMDSKVNV